MVKCYEFFKVAPMKADLISITPPEEVVKVWVNSRPDILSLKNGMVHDSASGKDYTVDEYLKLLIDMNLSSLYFANITCEVHSSLLVREYFYHFDNYLAQWAKTNRNGIDEENLIASSEAFSKEDIPYYDSFYEMLKKFKSGEGERNFDKIKENLPLSYQTTWQFSMPVKLLMRILGYSFKKFGICKLTKEMWLAFNTIQELEPYMKLVGKYITYSDPLFPGEFADKASSSNGYIVVRKNIGLTVFSHLIRHEGLHIGGYIHFMHKWLTGNGNRTGKGLTFDCSIRTSEARWIEIIKLRTSWFAMTDDWDSPNTWGVFLKDYITGDLDADAKYLKYFDLTGKFLPNEVKAYESETSIRVRKGNKTQLPDAFILESPNIVVQRAINVGWNPLLRDYAQMFAKGYVKDNPDNEMRKVWESYENSNIDTCK